MVLAKIDIAVSKRVRTLPMPQAELPLALVSITIRPLVLSVSMSFVLVPLADVAVTSDALPDTIAVFDSIKPFSIVSVAVNPGVEPFARDSTLIILAQVLITVAEAFVALAMALISDPFALVNPADLIDTDARTMAFLIVNLTTIERLLVTLDREVLACFQLFKVKQVGYHFVDHVLLFFFHGQVFMRMAAFFLLLSSSLLIGSFANEIDIQIR